MPRQPPPTPYIRSCPPLYRYLDAATLVELAPRLAALVRRGVGLNTRAGAGRFIVQLARRLGADIQPASPQLMKVSTSCSSMDLRGSI